jgi:SAM-dependent methyltransferase
MMRDHMPGPETDQPIAQTQGDLPPLPIRAIARGMSAVVGRAPFLWPVLRAPTRRFWERAAERWDDRIRPDSAEHLAPLRAACDRLESEPRRILELGTGTGAGAAMLVERFPGGAVWAVDIAEAMIREAERKAPQDAKARLHYAVADAAALPFDDASFDLVCQLNLPLYAHEIVRVLAPGGHVVIASSRGPRTPYYTPDRLLRRRFEHHGLQALPGGRVGEGTYFLARRPPAE